MYLSKVIITNFKTIFGSIELEFSKSMTLLTGSNGSGKSNILDAISFALGAQDDRQEGTAIELISKDFNNDKRLADFCEVTVFFKNNRPNETISVSRQLRVPKSGQIYSVYKLNGKNSSLTEILELLENYGIEKEGYNTVKQGEISTRMNESSESRRQLIEKISGVSQFDPKIREADAKISNARNTLRHVELLIEEAGKRLENLEKEKERTLKSRDLISKINYQKALKLQNTINKMDTKINGYDTEISSHINQINDLKKDITNFNKKLGEIKGKIDEELMKKRKLDQKKMQMTGASRVQIQNLETVNRKIYILKEKISDLKRKINVFETKSKKDLLKVKKKLKKNYSRSIEEDKENKELSRKLQEDILILEDKLPGLEEEYENFIIKRDRINEKIGECIDEKGKIDEKRRDWKSKVEINSSKKEQYTQRVEELNKLVSSIDRNLRSLDQRKNRISKEKSQVENFLKSARTNIRELFSQLTELETQDNDFKSRLTEWERALKKSQPRYADSVMKILAARDEKKLKGVVGTVLELIMEINRDYALAIEIAGGNKLQSIVLNNFASMIEVIEYIKTNELGSVSFYPMDIVEKWENKKIPDDKNIVGKVIDFIKFDPKYENIFSVLFKNTIIVKNLEDAKKYRNFRCVTIEGDLIEKNGEVITMGQFDSRFLLINEFYRRKIHEININISNLENRIKKLKNQVNSLTRDREKSDKRKFSIIEEIGEIGGRVIELKNQKNEIQPTLDEIMPKYNNITDQLKEAITYYENTDIELSKILDKIKDLELEKSEIQSKIDETEYGDVENQIKSKREQLTAVHRKILASEKDRIGYSNKLNQIDNQITLIDNQIIEFQNQIKEKNEENSSLVEEKDTLTEEINKQKEKFKKIDLEIQEINEKLDELQKTRADIIQQREIINVEINNIQSKINDINKSKSTIEERRRNLQNKIKEFGIKVKIKNELNLEEVENKIHELEVKLSMLGPIDHSAPEKYNQEKVRIKDLLEKRKTCQDELDSASEMYKEMYQQKQRRFSETLEKLNDNLKFIFNKIHSDGTIELISNSDDDPLEGGVDIRVDMGSGIVSSTRSLSGGQSSVVAASIIFAIQRLYTRSMWYFLDEIDAHLDDTHSEALGKLLKELSTESQYIITTPRKSYLREYAQRIYSLWKQNGFTKIVCQKKEQYN
jgi:chromosome segregation protein